MPWIQLITQTTKDTQEALEDSLLAAGALAVTLEDKEDQPILEPGVGEMPLWDNITLTALFDAEADTTAVAAYLTDAHPKIQFRWEQLEDKDWEREWMQNYHPIQFGERLWVVPGWETPPQADAVNLILDPGLAFGTGTHPTTALCLRWLDGLDLAGKTIIDYGCGSGILGIAALLLGAKHLIAIDNDPQALIATKDNAERNGISPQQYQLHLPENAPTPLQGDLLIANILAAPLVSLAPLFSQTLSADAPIALSGILDTQIPMIEEAYTAYFHLDKPTQEGDWIRITGKKRDL